MNVKYGFKVAQATRPPKNSSQFLALLVQEGVPVNGGFSREDKGETPLALASAAGAPHMKTGLIINGQIDESSYTDASILLVKFTSCKVC